MRLFQCFKPIILSTFLSTLLSTVLSTNIAFADDEPPPSTWPIERFNEDASACSRAFQPDSVVTERICRKCLSEIADHASRFDRPHLLTSMAKTQCEIKTQVFPEAEYTGKSWYIDNDVLGVDNWIDKNDDRNYTMGIAYARNGKRYSRGRMANSRAWIDNLFSLHALNGAVEQFHSAEIGVTAFTPGMLEEVSPILGDRPYAGLVYYASGKTTAYANGYTNKTKLIIGILGLNIARSGQRFMHNELEFSNQDPLGWHNQISRGGEITTLYSWERINEYETSSKVWDIAFSRAVNIGYYTDVSAGFDLRLGRIVSPYYSHIANPLSSVNHGVCYNCDGNDNFFFLNYRLRIVGYNVMLQGQVRDNPVEFSDSEVTRVLHEAGIGWTKKLCKGWQFTYALSYKSKEFKSDFEREHWFGGLYFSKNFK